MKNFNRVRNQKSSTGNQTKRSGYGSQCIQAENSRAINGWQLDLWNQKEE
ncbi:hypothetical protein ACFLSV_00810 [Bacteroidota bacterium]